MNNKNKLKDYIYLYLIFAKLGLFTFGGGYSMIGLIEIEFVEKKKYITHNELLDIVAIAESTPGPVAINTATFIGNKKLGVLGGIIATLGTITPSIIIITIIASFYDKLINIELINKALNGIIASVVILILTSSIKLSKGLKNNGNIYINIILLILTIILKLFTNIPSILIIFIAALIGIIIYVFILNKNNNNIERRNK